jgi:hypothetical protein
MVQFDSVIPGRLGISALPFVLLFWREESHLGWFSLDAPAIFGHPYVAIELHLV